MRYSFILSLSLVFAVSCKTAPSSKDYYDAVQKSKNLKTANSDPCPEEREDCHPRRFLVADDGLQKVSYVNLDDPSKDWDTKVEATVWDLQLGGDGKVLVPTTEGIGGYLEIDIQSGAISRSHTDLGFVRSVQRLSNGHTLVAGENLKGNEGTVIIELDKNGQVLENKTKRFPKVRNSRVIRRTRDNTFLMGTTVDNQSEHYLVEMDEHAYELQRFPVGSGPAHMGVRLPNGDTAVSSGRDLKLLFFNKDAKIIKTITMKNQTGKVPIDPFQAGFFQFLANGHVVLANWQGKNTTSGKKGRQLVEYNAEGEQVWAWKQDAKRFSSISAFLVLDGLDLSKAHDDSNGALEPSL